MLIRNNKYDHYKGHYVKDILHVTEAKRVYRTDQIPFTCIVLHIGEKYGQVEEEDYKNTEQKGNNEKGGSKRIIQ